MENKKCPPRSTRKYSITKNQIEKADALVRVALTFFIALGLTALFMVVVISILLLSLRGSLEQSIGMLNTVLTLVTTVLGTVTGYLFGKNSGRNK